MTYEFVSSLTFFLFQSMKHYDVFNGDADGLCSLQQLRLVEPIESILITGVKRDIDLLQQVSAQPGDQITVLDISLDKNKSALVRLLSQQVYVRYFDHHTTFDIPTHSHLTACIGTQADKGTSLLVNEFLGNQFPAWAIVGTFGDNFDVRAKQIAVSLGYTTEQIALLQNLGIVLNYNSYGLSIEDLHIAPATLSLLMRPFVDPLEFIATSDIFQQLNVGYQEDMAQVAKVTPQLETERYDVYLLPNAAWARRVSGVFANQLVHTYPQRAHALLTTLPTGGFLVSVRAPKHTLTGADVLCQQFPTGGGRKAAAGINFLPEDQYATFIRALQQTF